MSSIRKPKRLIICGNDEKEYSFLVKGGEDLRLDQRVQQIFTVMNQLLQHNPETAKRKLHIHTYQVVPMTCRVGILEWINETMPLKGILEKKLSEFTGGRETSLLGGSEAAKLQEQFLEKHNKTNSNNLLDKYGQAMKHASVADTTTKFQNQENTLKWDLLRSSIMAFTREPEAWVAMRQKAASSLGAFCMGSYIIGIGDRHLDNFLISLNE